MNKLILTCLLLSLALPAAATDPEQMIDSMTVLDGVESVRHVKIGSLMSIPEISKWDALPAQLIAHDRIAGGEAFHIVFMKTVDKQLVRMLYLGNQGTAIGVDYNLRQICTLNTGGPGPLEQLCLPFVKD